MYEPGDLNCCSGCIWVVRIAEVLPLSRISIVSLSGEQRLDSLLVQFSIKVVVHFIGTRKNSMYSTLNQILTDRQIRTSEAWYTWPTSSGTRDLINHAEPNNLNRSHGGRNPGYTRHHWTDLTGDGVPKTIGCNEHRAGDGAFMIWEGR
jgi:hypothetical protein